MSFRHGPRILATLLLAACVASAASGLEAQDTFEGETLAQAAADPGEAEALRAVAYPGGSFAVTVEDAAPGEGPDTLLHFPAPQPAAGRGDRSRPVRLCWWRAKQAEAGPRPAVLIVHSLAPGQPLARGLAGSLAASGVNAFVVDLPGYGVRAPAAGRSPGAEAVLSGAGGVADVRRSLDAVAALQEIDPDRIVLAGISMGSFAAASVAALDDRPAALVSFLGGGSAFEGLRDGAKDAALLREELLRGGETLESLEALLRPAEPLALAHRLNPGKVWVFSATGDTVIPPSNTEALVRAVGGVGLPDEHWIRRQGNHYTAGFAMPGMAALLVRLAEGTQ